MANKKISELSTRTPSLSDLMLVGDPSSGYSYKCTITSLATIIETDIADGYVTLSTAQTISGAKTFSNNLTLTSVSNAGVDTDKFLVLNGSNVVNFRTGSEVLSDIGGQGALTLTTTGTSGAATLVGNTLNIPQYQAVLTNPVTGTGTTNYIPKFTGTSAIGNSIMYEGTFAIGIGTITPFGGSSNYTALDLRGTVGSIIALGNTSNSITGRFLELSATSSNAQIFSLNSAPLSFGTESLSRLSIDTSGNVTISVIANATTDTDKFLVSDGGVIKYRTGSEVLSDIGAAASTSISGTTNYIPKFTSSSAIGNSQIFDNGTNVGIGTTIPGNKLTVSNGSDVGYLDFNNQSFILGTSTGSGISLFSSSATGVMTFSTNSTLRMTLDASGNLGLGVTPSAWNAVFKVLESGDANNQSTLAFQNNANVIYLTTNSYFDTSWKYKFSDNAGQYLIDGNEHRWYIAPSGTAGNAISFTQAMTLDASGRLGIGTTSPDANLQVNRSTQQTDITSASQVLSLLNTSTDANNNATGIRLRQENGTNSANSFIGIISTGSSSTRASMIFAPPNTSGDATERMRITSGGNVGIGTTSPKTITNGLSLTIGDGATQTQPYLALARTASGGYWAGIRWFDNNTIKSYIQEDSDFDLRFGTSNTERMRITSGGNVGIGTTNPIQPLTVAAASNANTIALLGRSSDNAQRIDFYNNAGNTRLFTLATGNSQTELYNDANIPMIFSTNAAERMRITSGGNVLIGTTTDSGAKLSVKGGTIDYAGDTRYGVSRIYDSSNGDMFGLEQVSAVQTGLNAATRLFTSAIGSADLILGKYTNATSFTSFLTLSNSGNAVFAGSIKTAAPSGGTAKPFKIGAAATVTPTSPNRTIEIEIDGVTYYLTAKTTND